MAKKDNIVGRSLKVKELVQYQKESVVSRTLINKESSTITVFAFYKGQGLSEHTASFDALVHILEGQAMIKISGKSHFLQTGEMIVMPAQQPHSLEAIENFKMMLVMIKQ